MIGLPGCGVQDMQYDSGAYGSPTPGVHPEKTFPDGGMHMVTPPHGAPGQGTSRIASMDGGTQRQSVNWASESIDVATPNHSAGDRIDFWREMILRLFADVEIGAVGTPDFFGKVKSQKCDLLRISDVSAAAQAVNRRHLQPRSRDEDKYFAVLMLQGTESLEQDGNRTIIGPGDFAVYDATRPHQLSFTDDWRQIIVSVPRTSLDQRVMHMERRIATRVSTDTPTGRVMRMFLQSIAGQIGAFTSAEMASLSEAATNVITLAMGNLHPLDAEHSRCKTLTLMRVKMFVNDHLRDPALSVSQVTSALGLSSRYVNRLFEAEGLSLMRYVLRRRLDRCAMDLVSPSQAARRISEIAFAWGFNDLSHFGRAFREAHGCSPSEWRESAGRGI
jgi:AraC-like DNA-binding protein